MGDFISFETFGFVFVFSSQNEKKFSFSSLFEEANDVYVLPYDEQLKERGIDGNPSINQMLEIVLSDSTSNRPFIRSSWRKSTLINEKLIRTIEQCWDSTPEGRISASLVAHRLKSSLN